MQSGRGGEIIPFGHEEGCNAVKIIEHLRVSSDRGKPRQNRHEKQYMGEIGFAHGG